MNVTDLHPLHKQLGNKIIEFKDSQINGYNIDTYERYEPVAITLDATIARPNRALSFDGAYDLLYGEPGAPDFTSTITI